MTREEAYTLLTHYLKNKNLLKHSFAAEAAMKGIYRYLYDAKPEYSKDMEETWGIVGLLHDGDYELAMNTNQLDKHGLLLFDPSITLRTSQPSVNIPEHIAHAIKAHNYENTKVLPENDMDWAIACCDQLTGLLVSSALIHPDKKLSSIDTDFVLKRFGEKAFSKGVKREGIQMCEEKLGIPLREFIQITLKSMQEIHGELGL